MPAPGPPLWARGLQGVEGKMDDDRELREGPVGFPYAQVGLAAYLRRDELPVSDAALAEVRQSLIERLQKEFDSSVFYEKKPEHRQTFEEAAWRILGELSARRTDLHLSRAQEEKLIRGVVNQIAGLGVLEDYLPPFRTDLEELSLTPDGRLWLSIRGHAGWTQDTSFECSPADARNAALRILEMVRRTVTEMRPIEDGRIPRSVSLASGARFNVALPPIASGQYPAINLRFWSQDMPQLQDLLAWRSLDQPMADFLVQAVQAHTNLIVAGGTKTGKTTFLNILCAFIPAGERIVTVEDTQELRIGQGYPWVAMESRPPNMEGQGAVTLGDLVRNALRQSPDWLIPGEIRDGVAAYEALRAMSTGHWGMTTVHTDSAYDTPRQVVNLAQGAGFYAGNKEAAKERFAAAIRLVVHLGRLPGSSRRVVTRICEVEPELRKGDVYMRDLFRYDPGQDQWVQASQAQWLGRLAWEVSHSED